MATTKKFHFTLDQVSDVQFDAEKKILSFTVGDETKEVPIASKEDPSSIESIEFSDNQILSLADIAEAFDLPEIVTAAGASPDTSGLSQYDDNAGDLIGGIDRLGTLEPSRVAFDVEERDVFYGAINNTNGGDDDGDNSPFTVVFHPDTTEVFESHLDHGTHLVHGEVVDQDDSYTKATGTFEITGEGEYKGEVTFSIGDKSVSMELPSVGESCTKNIGEDTYTITHDTNGHYSYEYTLNSPKDHSGAPTDSHGDKFLDTHIEVTVTDPTDNTAMGSGGTDIHIINDGITATDPGTIHLTEASQHYVTIALDVSGSMGWSAEWGKNVPSGKDTGETRYQVAVKALIALMEEYKEVSPDTQVNLFLFNSGVTPIDAHTPQEVINHLNRFNYNTIGGTNYTKVLDAMLDTVKKGTTHSDYTNQVIFISDGEPNSKEETSKKWQDFVKGGDAKDLDIFSVGIGSGINDKAEKYLKDICNSEELGQDKGDMYVHVKDLDDLKDALHDVTNIVSGNLAAENVLGADGVDSFYGFVDESGKDHKIDWSGATDTIDKDGYYHIYLAGKEGDADYTLMKINSHGDYILQVHGTVKEADYNNIKLILEDTDGDRLTLTGKIEIHASSSGNSISKNSLVLSASDTHDSDTVTDDTHHLAASGNHTSDTITNDAHNLVASEAHTALTDDTHSLAASDSHTSDTDTLDTLNLTASDDSISNTVIDGTPNLIAGYDHIFEAITNEVDIFNFTKHKQNSSAEHVNIFTLDSGSNLINNFTLGEDKISFEDILSEDDPLTLTSIMSHLEDGLLSVEEINDHSSEITIALDGHEPTTIDINFDSSIYTSPDPSLEEQALLFLRITNGC